MSLNLPFQSSDKQTEKFKDHTLAPSFVAIFMILLTKQH